MKKQSITARIHEHLGATHKGPHKESLVSRAKESKGMEKHFHHSAAHAIKDHDHHKKMHHHHIKEAMKHLDRMHKMVKHRHVTKHDKAVDRHNLEK